MDFRMLNGASFRVWKHFCSLCNRQGDGGIKQSQNRLIKAGCALAVAEALDYNPQTVTQSIHTLKEAGFITEIKNPLNAQESAYFMHVILMGECIPLPDNVEQLVHRFCVESVPEMAG